MAAATAAAAAAAAAVAAACKRRGSRCQLTCAEAARGGGRNDLVKWGWEVGRNGSCVMGKRRPFRNCLQWNLDKQWMELRQKFIKGSSWLGLSTYQNCAYCGSTVVSEEKKCYFLLSILNTCGDFTVHVVLQEPPSMFPSGPISGSG